MLRNALGHARRTAKQNGPPAIKKWKILRGDQVMDGTEPPTGGIHIILLPLFCVRSQVEVTRGKFKGQQGTVLKALRQTNQLIVEGVNVVSSFPNTQSS